MSDDRSKRFYITCLHPPIHTHIHTMAARPPASSHTHNTNDTAWGLKLRRNLWRAEARDWITDLLIGRRLLYLLSPLQRHQQVEMKYLGINHMDWEQILCRRCILMILEILWLCLKLLSLSPIYCSLYNTHSVVCSLASCKFRLPTLFNLHHVASSFILANVRMLNWA